MSEATQRITGAKRALRLLFARPGDDGELTLPAIPALRRLSNALQLSTNTAAETGEACAEDYLNALRRELDSDDLGRELDSLLFDAMIDHRVLPAALLARHWDENTRFLLQKAHELLLGVAALIEELPSDTGLLLPATARMLCSLRVPGGTGSRPLRTLANRLSECDRFRRCRAFQYHAGVFAPVELTAAKPIDKFFGFPSVRAQFEDHFAAFARGENNLPLLVYSLPGYGKTSMTVSHAAATPGVVLIMPSPESLEHGWCELIAPLAARPDHKFVVFFDDIDPRHIDWYEFRTNVGGAFALPSNILPVLASNYEFPANILSRGRKVNYPVFDELRCMEMVEEFLAADFGMHTPSRNLISLIAAGYTEDFGQKKFTELSPRSLIRYLRQYQTDRIKRKTVVELSFGPMITRPDAQLFYEFNVDLMRALYGEEYIQQLLRERLKELEK